MAKLRHIAVSTQDPERIATFYKEVFGMKEISDPRMREVSRHGSIRLTDGYINLVIQKCRTDKGLIPGTIGPSGIGIHHIGFEVDDLDRVCEKLERNQGKQLTPRARRTGVGAGRKTNEQKWAAPDGVVLDISSTGWEVS